MNDLAVTERWQLLAKPLRGRADGGPMWRCAAVPPGSGILHDNVGKLGAHVPGALGNLDGNAAGNRPVDLGGG